MVFICKYCNNILSEKRNLKRHIKSEHEITNLRCEKCEFTTDRLDCLKRHIKTKHYQNKIKYPECSVEFGRKDSMEKHKNEYHKKDPLTPLDRKVERVHSSIFDTVTPTVTPTPKMVHRRKKGHSESLHILQRN